jgi:hypothetical protein
MLWRSGNLIVGLGGMDHLHPQMIHATQSHVPLAQRYCNPPECLT